MKKIIKKVEYLLEDALIAYEKEKDQATKELLQDLIGELQEFIKYSSNDDWLENLKKAAQ